MSLFVKGRHSRPGRLEPLLGRLDPVIAMLALSCVAAAAALIVLLVRLAPGPLLKEVVPADPLDFESVAGGGETGWRVVGRSVEGRPIRLATFGEGPRRVLVVGGVHGSEYGADAAAAFAAYLSAQPSAVPEGVAVDVLPCLDPDGRVRDRTANAHGVDLNRNFPAKSWRPSRERNGSTAGPRPASEPETRVMMEVLAGGYSRVVSLHSRGPLVDYDGPGGAALARTMARRCGYPVERLADIERFTGSMGDYVPQRYGIPIVTLELASRQSTPGVRAALLEALR